MEACIAINSWPPTNRATTRTATGEVEDSEADAAATIGRTEVAPMTARIHSTGAGMTIAAKVEAEPLIVAAAGLSHLGMSLFRAASML